jgi:hypothetical protein
LRQIADLLWIALEIVLSVLKTKEFTGIMTVMSWEDEYRSSDWQRKEMHR